MRIKSMSMILACLVFLAVMMQGIATAGARQIIRDTEIEHILLKIVQPMAAHAGIEGRNPGVRIVIDSEYNAYVIGDNNIYVHSGLLLKSENILEVAGVLAHEIGHIASHHVARRGEVVGRANTAAGAIAFGAAVAAALAGSAEGTYAAIGVAVGGADQAQRIVLAHSRQDEGVADEWAIRLMEAEMLSLRPMANAMRRIGNQRLLPASRQSGYYQSHPSMHERSAVLQDYINRNEGGAAGTGDTPPELQRGFARIRAKLGAWTDVPAGNQAEEAADSVNSRFAEAIRLYRKSDPAEAAKRMAALIADVPNDPYLREFHGDVLLASGKPAEAAAQYETALELLAGDNAVNRGQILLALGRAYTATDAPEHLPRAIAALEEATVLEPGWAFAKKQLGISYGKAGRVAEADLTLAESELILAAAASRSGGGDIAAQVAARARATAKLLAGRVVNNPDASPQLRQRALDITARDGHSGGASQNQ